VCGGFAGLLGHCFVNDGKIAEPTPWGHTDLLLPYAGERYCVQGHRGFISHFTWRQSYTPTAGGPARERWRGGEEFSYDFSVPLGSPVLAVKAGHIIRFKEDRDGSVREGNSIANYVYVKHQDGTVAHYLHIKKNGFREVNPTIQPLGVATADPDGADRNYFTTDVHVHAGQVLAAAGHTGISMFPHIHFTVERAGGAAVDGNKCIPVKFADADCARHDGRCFSMRLYKSDNVDRGPVQLP